MLINAAPVTGLAFVEMTEAVPGELLKRPPDERAVKWNKRPLVWVTGKETKADRVPAQDFVFAALKLAVDEHETWTGPVTALYRRAVTNVGALCKAFDTFELGSEVGCH